MVHTIGEEVKSKIKGALENSRRVAVTTDIWSKSMCTDSYIGFTVHFVNVKTKKKEVYRLCCREFNVSHTAANISKIMTTIFKEFDIQSKVFRVLTDNAANMIAAFRDINDQEQEGFDDFEDTDSETELLRRWCTL